MTSVLDFINKNKIIVICRRVYGKPLSDLAAALHSGGIRLLEITFDQADNDCIKHTADSISMLCEEYGDTMMFGAGTVINKKQVGAAAGAGAKFIISPNVDSEVIASTKELDLVSIPGAMTPSEIITAHNLGADIVKLFPSGTLGFAYIKDILAPISHVRLCATGGVTEENLAEYLRLGFAGAGIGGRLCDKKLLASGEFSEIERRARVFTQIAAAY